MKRRRLRASSLFSIICFSVSTKLLLILTLLPALVLDLVVLVIVLTLAHCLVPCLALCLVPCLRLNQLDEQRALSLNSSHLT